ncbi:MAG TPA: DUF3471 domain-containing protein, partial [Longimicrobiales bacterium]|nr:DUF3471 domain-containing protein [Longimicrobiales bacterium]
SAAMNIGLAWHILMRPDRQITWHNGGTGGYRTFAGFDAKNQRAVVVLTNMNRSADDLGFHLLDPSIPVAPPPTAAPKVRREVSVAAAVLQQYVGDYELAPTFIITITREEDRLYGQPTAQPRFRLWAESETDFFLKEVDAQVRFTKDSAGNVSLTLFQGGQALPGRKIR